VFEGADDPGGGAKRSYRVKRGDNLGSIAKANKVDVKDLQRWNKLSGKNLKGQTLVLQDTRGAHQHRGAANAKTKGKPSHNPVQGQQGDSLYMVAKRFNVEMQHLKRWNPRAARPSSRADADRLPPH
jgi:membrane-bound lytic murein transglycosylase D